MLSLLLVLLHLTWQPGQQWRATLQAEQRFFASSASDSPDMLLHSKISTRIDTKDQPDGLASRAALLCQQHL